MSNATPLLTSALKTLCISIATIAALDLCIVCFGRWLQLQIPVAVVLGLNLGVIAYFATKLHRPK